MQAGRGTVIPASSSTSKKDSLKVTRYKADQNSGPYERPVLSTVNRKLLQEFDAFEFPKLACLSFMQCLIRNETLRYFTEIIR